MRQGRVKQSLTSSLGNKIMAWKKYKSEDFDAGDGEYAGVIKRFIVKADLMFTLMFTF